MHYSFPQRQRARVSPAPGVASSSQVQQTYKTIKQEAAEYKEKMRAMREREAAEKKKRRPQKPRNKPVHPREKPVHPRENRLHREPSQFKGVLKEGWNYRIELIKYYFSRIKKNTLPTLFCLRAEVDDQE